MKEKNKEDGNKKDNKKIITNFEYRRTRSKYNIFRR